MPLKATSQYSEMPVKWPVMFQTWDSLTFLHWPYQPHVIRRLVPPQLEIDTFDGAAWVGLTPFLLTGLRPPLLPRIPWISTFPEMNVRTYVRGPDGERGIWFLSLEAGRLLAVVGARLSYQLPYRWAKMKVRKQGATVEYLSERHFGPGRARIAVLRGSPIEPGELEVFLTARFRLYTAVARRLAFAQVEHPPWPLESALAMHVEENVIENSNLPRPEGKPLVHFSSGVRVRVGRLKLVRTN